MIEYKNPILAPALDRLRVLIENSPHSLASASLSAGLGHATVRRWLEGDREPRLSELNRALSVFGLTLELTLVPYRQERP